MTSSAPTLGPVGAPGDIYVDAPNVAPPPGNPRFALFDSLRAIAALSVFGAHSILETNTEQAHPFFKWMPELSLEGVTIFFLISGFLLYRPFLVARRSGRPLRTRDYARRRVLRIVPAFWVALIVVNLVLQHPNGLTAHNWWEIYGFGQIYQESTIGYGIGAAWTLCVEVTFYALLPLLAYAASRLCGADRRSLRGDIYLLVGLTIASIAFHQYFYTTTNHFFWAGTLPGSFYWFALGMGLAIASVLHEERKDTSRLVRFVVDRPSLFWIAAVILFFVMHMSISQSIKIGTGSTIEHLIAGIVALFVLLPAVFGEHAGGLPRHILRLRWLSWLGVVSYGFYLYHSDIITALTHRLIVRHWPHSYPLVLVGSFILACMFAAASYYLLERPILRLKNVPLTGRLGKRSSPSR